MDDLDRLGTKDAQAVDVMDNVFMLLGTETRVPVLCILAVDSEVVSRAIAHKYNGKDSRLRALEYLGKILQLSVGLPQPDEAKKRRLLQNVVPAKAGGIRRRKQAGAATGRPLLLPPGSGSPQAGPTAEDAVIGIMENDPLLGFEQEERDSFQRIARFLTPNTRKAKRVANSYRFFRTICTGIDEAERRRLESMVTKQDIATCGRMSRAEIWCGTVLKLFCMAEQ